MNDLLIIVLVAFVYYFILFVIGTIKKNNSIVDIGWGLSYVVVTIFALFALSDLTVVNFVATLLVVIWGMRLTIHIGKRNIGKKEDFRYVNMREKWGSNFVLLKAFINVYFLQMILMLIIASGVLLTIIEGREKFNLINLIGILIWIIGFAFEVISDEQLRRFKNRPENKGKILTTGLYKVSRHPNYFGEALIWWGIFLIALSSNISYVMIISPITITILLRYVSGVPLLEEHYKNNDAYQLYAEKTSIFIPFMKRRR